MNARYIALNILRYAVSLAVLLILWQAAITLFDIKPFLLPRPLDVMRTLANDSSLFARASVFTFSNMLAGAAIGIGLGATAGFALSYVPIARWVGEPYLVIFQSFPRESLLPLMVVWLGFGATSKIANAAMLSFFPIAIIVLQALSDTRRDYLSFVESLGANRFEQFAFCRLPNAVPSILGAIKIGLPLALIGAVLGEFMGGDKGLGYLILTSGSAFRVDRVFGAIVILSAYGTSLLSIVVLIEKTIAHRFFQS
jgi:ABC-type nitrate/sulfonate/bicarbonate transport system permease component